MEPPPAPSALLPFVRQASAADILELYNQLWWGAPQACPVVLPAVRDSRYRRWGSNGQLSDGADSDGSGGTAKLHVASVDSRAQSSVYDRSRADSGHSGRKQQQQQHRQQQQQQQFGAARAASAAQPAGQSAAEGSSSSQGRLGTWAGRQRVFVAHLDEEEQLRHAAQQSTRPDPGSVPREGSPAQRIPGEAAAPREALRPPLTEDSAVHEAWRWRFSRKWATEQQKQLDPDYGNDGSPAEEWSHALQVMDAVGGGLNLQIARTSSTEKYSSMEQSSLMDPSLSQSLLLDGSVSSPATLTEATATSHLVNVARKAQHLLREQREIERQVSERWDVASSNAWVGQYVNAVAIDSWGKFRWVLVRVSDRGGRQKLLVRGKNACDDRQAFNGLEQEVARAAVQHRLPNPRLELLGQGWMEWQRGDKERSLAVQANTLHSAAAQDARLQHVKDLGRMVAQLARSSLAGAFGITVNGEELGTSQPAPAARVT